MTAALSAALTVLLAAASLAQEPAAVELRGLYDKAFAYYVAKDYPRAIEQWNLILRADPKQITAKNMIDDARQKMAGAGASLKGEYYSLLEKGRYSDALGKLEAMLASDPTNPVYAKLQSRLRKISSLVPRKTSSARGWVMAAAGIAAWAAEKEDLNFAYDALRYAAELSPSEKPLAALLALLEEENPGLRLNDTKPGSVPVLEHKKELALRHIYDSKYYLAAKELEGVLRLEPQDVTALKRAGSVYLQLKDYPKARRAWQKAAELAPGDEQLKEYLSALDAAAPAAKAQSEEPSPRKRARKKSTRSR